MDELDKLGEEARQLVEDFKNCHVTQERVGTRLETLLFKAFLVGKDAAREEPE